jgi:tetratricopeptide (TPR) repeat protein
VGELRLLSGNLDESVEAFGRAAALAESDIIRRATLTLRRARALTRAGRYSSALRVMGRAMQILGERSGPGADRVRAQADNLRSLIRIGQEKPRDARVAALAAADSARRVDDPETLVRALMAIDDAEHQLGLPSTGRYTEEALEVCVANGLKYQESVARLNLGVWAFFAGRWDEAIDYYRSSRIVALEAGNACGAAETDVNLGEVLISRGEVNEAERILKDAIRVLRVSQMEWEATYGETMISRVYLFRREYDTAEALLSQIVERFLSMKSPTVALEAILIRAEVASSLGEFERALDLVDQGEAFTGGHRGPLASRMALQRATAYHGLDRLEECAIAIDDGLRVAREQSQPYEEALLLHAQHRLALRVGDQVQADLAGERAHGLLKQLGARHGVPDAQRMPAEDQPPRLA